MSTVEAALRIARQEGARTILDPAPVRPLSDECLAEVDILTPNESEACLLLDRPVRRIGPEEAPELAQAILATGPKAVILKLGEIGCYYTDGKSSHLAPGFEVEAVDTTAAGDTFNGALAVALAESLPIEDALRFANAAAALSVTRMGAQASVPAREEVDAFLAQRTP
jgi:ribokinase